LSQERRHTLRTFALTFIQERRGEEFSEVQKKLTQNTNSINSWLKFIADSSPWPILPSAEGSRRFWASDARWKGGRENGEPMKDCPG
jgi:hypothetical protein